MKPNNATKRRLYWAGLAVLLLAMSSLSTCGQIPSPIVSPTSVLTIAPSVASTTSPIPTTTPTAVPTSTPRPSLPPTATPTPDPIAFLQEIGANELGWILVLEYHMIAEPEDRWSRTPDNFRQDIARLIAEGYYPINLIDLARGSIDVPAGKTPIVLTFDDSSSGQFRYLENGTVDPNSAVGILLEAANRQPEVWRPRATFFVLLDVDIKDRVLFGQEEWAEQKLRNLAEWGMEVGSHTISHFRLDLGTAEEIRWQLAVSEQTIETMIPGYELESLSVPLGMYPADETLLYGGNWQGQHYDFSAAVEVAGGPSPSPFSINFDPYHIRRTQAFTEELDAWLSFFQNHPELRYVSDGDPSIVTIPDPLPDKLQGILSDESSTGMSVRTYPAVP